LKHPDNYDDAHANLLYDFLDLIVERQNAKSARLLELILDFSPYNIEGIEGSEKQKRSLVEHLALEIRRNNCPQYAFLIKATEQYIDAAALRYLAESGQTVGRNSNTPWPVIFEDKKENDRPYIAFWYQ
jgi:hypothetical protein